MICFDVEHLFNNMSMMFVYICRVSEINVLIRVHVIQIICNILTFVMAGMFRGRMDAQQYVSYVYLYLLRE